MIKSIYVLSLALAISAGVEFDKHDLDAIVLLSAATGLFSVTQWQADWKKNVSWKGLKTRYPITLVGKLSGFISTALLITYFVALFFGMKL
jgi:hypothetical protein